MFVRLVPSLLASVWLASCVLGTSPAKEARLMAQEPFSPAYRIGVLAFVKEGRTTTDSAAGGRTTIPSVFHGETGGDADHPTLDALERQYAGILVEWLGVDASPLPRGEIQRRVEADWLMGPVYHAKAVAKEQGYQAYLVAVFEPTIHRNAATLKPVSFAVDTRLSLRSVERDAPLLWYEELHECPGVVAASDPGEAARRCEERAFAAMTSLLLSRLDARKREVAASQEERPAK